MLQPNNSPITSDTTLKKNKKQNSTSLVEDILNSSAQIKRNWKVKDKRKKSHKTFIYTLCRGKAWFLLCVKTA